MSRLMTPKCPACETEPVFVIGIVAFCGNGDCALLSWDMSRSMEEIVNSVGYIHLNTE